MVICKWQGKRRKRRCLLNPKINLFTNLRDFYLTGVTRYRGTEISAWGFYATNTCLMIKAKGNVPTAGKKRKKVYITEQGLELGLIT